MIPKPRFPNYKDGYVSICDEKYIENDFAAKKNIATLEDLIFVVKLGYEEKSRRVQDYEIADQMNFSLSLKIKTRLNENVTNKNKALIKNFLYNVSYVDYDQANKEMYLYLEGVKELA